MRETKTQQQLPIPFSLAELLLHCKAPKNIPCAAVLDAPDVESRLQGIQKQNEVAAPQRDLECTLFLAHAHVVYHCTLLELQQRYADRSPSNSRAEHGENLYSACPRAHISCCATAS
jgi:hypothetical protein